MPIGDPDPLSKYKWWILGGLALVLVAAAAFLLRKPAGTPVVATVEPARAVASSPVHGAAFAAPASKNSALLNALKEELFALESEKAHRQYCTCGIHRGKGRARDRVEACFEAQSSKLESGRL